jgi:hypothetical protein
MSASVFSSRPAVAKSFPWPKSGLERGYWLALALLLPILAIANHWPVRNGFFQVDDFLWLDLAHWRSVAASFVGSQGAHVAYRPLFRVSVYIDALLFGRNAAWWHWENILFHAANSLLLAEVLRVFRLPRSVCAAASLLFLFAPLSGESINWISGRTSTLALIFMLLAVWRWAAALRDHRQPWAAAIWMVLGAMTYEAAAVLPLVLFCLLPLVRKRLAVEWPYALRQTLLLCAGLAAFWVLRAFFLGTFSGHTDVTGPDLLANFVNHLGALWRINQVVGTNVSLWVLAAALALATLHPRLFPAGPCLLIIALITLLPYVAVEGLGGRFLYMLQAPLCVMAVLPVLIIPRILRVPALALLLALLLPRFVPSDWHESDSFTAAGINTKALIEAIHAAIPANDGYANIIDDVPDLYNAQIMMGGFFELGVRDSYAGGQPPFIARSSTMLGSERMKADILAIPTRFWRYDLDARRLVPVERAAWLAAHPDAGSG